MVGTTPGGGAEASGLKEGDVILRVGGGATSALPPSWSGVSRYRPGESTTDEFWRDGVLQKREVELRDRSGAPRCAPLNRVWKSAMSASLSRLQMPRVISGSTSWTRKWCLRAGRHPRGARITALDGQSVRRAKDVADFLRSALEEDRKAVLVEGELPNGQQAWFGLGLR